MCLEALLTQIEEVTEHAAALVDATRNREIDHEALQSLLGQRERHIEELRSLLPTISPVGYTQYNRILAVVRRGNLILESLQLSRSRVVNALATGALGGAYAACLRGLVADEASARPVELMPVP